MGPLKSFIKRPRLLCPFRLILVLFCFACRKAFITVFADMLFCFYVYKFVSILGSSCSGLSTRTKFILRVNPKRDGRVARWQRRFRPYCKLPSQFAFLSWIRTHPKAVNSRLKLSVLLIAYRCRFELEYFSV